MSLFKGGLGDMMAQARKFQSDLKQIQESLESKTVEASSGGVRVIANGKQHIVSVTIDPELLKLNDRTRLQDLITSGVNQAIKSSQDLAAQEMSKLTAGLGPLASLLKGL